MTTTDFTLNGLYYDGKSPLSHRATLSVLGSHVKLCYADHEQLYAKSALMVSPKTGDLADRFIAFSDGGQYQCRDQAFLDSLPQQFATENIVAWLEKHISVAVISIVLVIASLCLGYFYGLPALAKKSVEKIPMETEASLGNYIFTWLDEHLLGPSEIEIDNRQEIEQGFEALQKDLQSASRIKLHFRTGNGIGANAFALPGGHIVITDELIRLAISNEEILAILAHEAGHVERRHALCSMLQNSIVMLAATTITSDVNMLGTTMASLPVLFLQSKYSRGFEDEADEFAIRLLEQNSISPQVFADILERIDEQYGIMQDDFSYLSTHPLTSERVARVRKTN